MIYTLSQKEAGRLARNSFSRKLLDVLSEQEILKSDREYAEDIGISSAHFSRILSGQIIPSFRLLSDISDYFEVSIAEFLPTPPSLLRLDLIRDEGEEVVRVNSIDENIKYRRLLPFYMKELLPIYRTELTFPEDKAPGFQWDIGEEFAFVLKGNINFEYFDELNNNFIQHTLSEGDYVWFDSNIFHRMKNIEGTAKILDIIYNSFGDAKIFYSSMPKRKIEQNTFPYDEFKADDTGMKEYKVGQKIRRRRINLGLSLHDLARLVDISPVTLRKYEQNKASAPVRKLNHIFSALKLNPEEVFPKYGKHFTKPQIVKSNDWNEFVPVQSVNHSVDATSDPRLFNTYVPEDSLYLNRNIQPLFMEYSYKNLEDLHFSRHPDKEFLYCLEGEVHFCYYSGKGTNSIDELFKGQDVENLPVSKVIEKEEEINQKLISDIEMLTPTDALYFDSSVPHCFRSIGKKDFRVLNVVLTKRIENAMLKE